MSQSNLYEVIKALQNSIKPVRQCEPELSIKNAFEMEFFLMDATHDILSHAFTTYVTADR